MGALRVPVKAGQKELIGRLVDRMKAGGVGEFIYPFKTGGLRRSPRNAISGRPYSGYNRFATTLVGWLNDFDETAWLTKTQIEARGGKIKTGEKSTAIIFTGRYRKKATLGSDKSVELPFNVAELPLPPINGRAESVETSSNPEEQEFGTFTKEFQVYNLQQTEDVKLPARMGAYNEDRAQRLLTWTPEDGLADLKDRLLNADIAPLHFDRIQSCYYDSGRHEIHAPAQGFFNSELGLWEAIAHETVHATGAKHLLNRGTIAQPFKSEGRALEEVTAVIGSLFICQETGVPISPEQERNWSAYLAHHDVIGIMEKNPSAFVQALVQADFATRFILEPDKRPQFIRDRKASAQIEFSFSEYAPASTDFGSFNASAIAEAVLMKAAQAAKELESAAPNRSIADYPID